MNLTGDLATPVRLLVVDDVEPVRHSLCTILRLVGGVEIVGEANDGLEAIELTEALKPDVVLMDLAMPRLDGLETTQRIKARNPTIGVVLFTIHDHAEVRAGANRVGVDAFVAKGTGTQSLVETIKQVRDKLCDHPGNYNRGSGSHL